MALDKGTGKSWGTVLKVGGTTMPGWRKITIDEKGQSLPTPIDVTAAQDASYTFVDDPLGGKTSANANVTVEGLLSVTDHQDTSGWLALALGSTYEVIVTTKPAGDEWTLAGMTFSNFTTGAEVAGVMPFTATFTHPTSAGAWATDVP